MRVFLVFCGIALAAALYLVVTGNVASPPPTSEIPAPAGAATYYIDAIHGDDEHDGRSEVSAWKTLERISRTPLLPGGTVLLRCGSVWRETLNISSSGGAEGPITVGSYGEGEPPSIRGSDAFTSPSDWRYETEGLWYLDDIREDPGLLARDDMLATRRKAKDELADPWDYWYDSGNRRVFVRLDANPAAMAEQIEVPVREFSAGPLGASRVRLLDLDFRHARKATLLLWEADHVEIEGCSFTQSAGTHVQIGRGSNHTRLSACEFDDWNTEGGRNYAIHALEAGSGPADVENCTFTATHRGAGDGHTAIRSDDKAWIRSVRACRFLGNGGFLAGDGISVWRPNSAASTMAIEDNLFQELGGSAIIVEELENYGGSLAVTIRRNRIEGVCLGDYPNRDAIGARLFPGGLATVLIASNIITGTAAGRYPHGGIGIQEARGVRLAHNAIQGTDDGIALRFGAVEAFVANNLLRGNRGPGLRDEMGRSTATHNAYFENGAEPNGALASGAGDVTSDPLLNGAFRPLAGSPCIDAGTDAGLDFDFARKPVPTGAAPDIGPFEFAPTTEGS